MQNTLYRFMLEQSGKYLSWKYFGSRQEQSQTYRKILFINTAYKYLSNLVQIFKLCEIWYCWLMELAQFENVFTWYWTWMLHFCWCQHKFENVSNRYFFSMRLFKKNVSVYVRIFCVSLPLQSHLIPVSFINLLKEYSGELTFPNFKMRLIFRHTRLCI